MNTKKAIKRKNEANLYLEIEDHEGMIFCHKIQTMLKCITIQDEQTIEYMIIEEEEDNDHPKLMELGEDYKTESIILETGLLKTINKMILRLDASDVSSILFKPWNNYKWFKCGEFISSRGLQ